MYAIALSMGQRQVPHHSGTRGARLHVAVAKRAAQHWVDEHVPTFHSFRGALLRGSTVWMRDDELWDGASDVDLTIYFAGPHEIIRHQKLRYEGV